MSGGPQGNFCYWGYGKALGMLSRMKCNRRDSKVVYVCRWALAPSFQWPSWLTFWIGRSYRCFAKKGPHANNVIMHRPLMLHGVVNWPAYVSMFSALGLRSCSRICSRVTPMMFLVKARNRSVGLRLSPVGIVSLGLAVLSLMRGLRGCHSRSTPYRSAACRRWQTAGF